MTGSRGGAKAMTGKQKTPEEGQEKNVERHVCESLYRDLVETSQDLVWQCDDEGRYTFLNPAWESVFGYSNEEMLGKKFTDFQTVEYAQRDQQEFIRLMDGNIVKGLETMHIGKDGRQINLLFNAKVVRDSDGRIIGTRGTAYDVTERKRSEEAVKESEFWLRESQRVAHLGSYVLDIRTGAWISSDSLDVIFGIGKDYDKSMDGWANLIHPEHREMMANYFAHEVVGKRKRFDKEYKIVRILDGEERWVQGFGELTLDGNGEPIKMFGTIQDITERRRMDDALRTSERKFRTVFDNAIVGIMVTDRKRRIIDSNAAFLRMLGYSRAELVGKTLADISDPEDDERNVALLNDAIVRKQDCFSMEKKYLRKDGSTLRGILSISLMRQGSGGEEAMIAMFEDITERRRSEEAMLNAQKIESIGILAGGIAHDFNNLLTAIIGNISFSKMHVQPDSKVARLLTDAENACAQAKDLSYRLLTFSKGGEPLRKVLPLSKILRNAVLFSLSGSNVLPEFELPDDLPLVAVDEGQIKQVINNLVMNAREAMPAGGVLRIAGTPVMVKTGDTLPLKQGPYLKLSFSDTGVGMSADVVSRIFEPYFSTKEMGPEKGRGLGLAICYSVLRKHEGLITAASEIGKGTVFHLYLPLASSDNLSRLGKVPGAGAEQAAKRRILFMDDEERVRTITKAILEFLIYEVECVKDGAEAVDAYQRAASIGRPFDLVILDLTVPGGMGGLDAFNRLREADPGVRAVVSSGYAEDPVLREYGNFGFAGALAKPYDVSKLREIISAVLPAKA